MCVYFRDIIPLIDKQLLPHPPVTRIDTGRWPAHCNIPVLSAQANKKGPEFTTAYHNTEQTIKVTFSALELLLHQESILSLLEFAQRLAPPEKKPEEEKTPTVPKMSTTTAPVTSPSTATVGGSVTAKPARKREWVWSVDSVCGLVQWVWSVCGCVQWVWSVDSVCGCV